MTDVHGFDQFQRPRGDGHSLPVAVVTAIDPVLRDALVASLLLDGQGVVELRYEVDAASAALRRLILRADGVIEDEVIHLEHPCVSCAMREDAVPTLARLAGDPRCAGVLLAPPLSADPTVVVGTLQPHQDRWHLAGAAAVLSSGSALDDLLGDATLAERGVQWADGD
ncbi:MAG: hypothetical protein ACTH9F_08790, partial [Brachybacterium tyrofermentans]